MANKNKRDAEGRENSKDLNKERGCTNGSCKEGHAKREYNEGKDQDFSKQCKNCSSKKSWKNEDEEESTERNQTGRNEDDRYED